MSFYISGVAQAPSNIALAKYMGKEDARHNIPSNSSLSMTLDSLRSVAEVRRFPDVKNWDDGKKVRWVREAPRTEGSFSAPDLSENGISKVEFHVERLCDALPEIFWDQGLDLDAQGSFEVRTINTFPTASGIASSASSFAAITLATAFACSKNPEAFSESFSERPAFRNQLSQVARQGSGSSCRSFDGSWVIWDADGEVQKTYTLESKLPQLTDLILLVQSEPKKISSSEAHLRVKSSPMWEGRVKRTRDRISTFREAIKEGDFETIGKTSWEEMWDMHTLFHTAKEPFTYWQPGTFQAMNWIFSEILHERNRPIITMDAGANFHFLVPTEDAGLWERKILQQFTEFRILKDRSGSGATPIDASAKEGLS
ncbi:hypothetical protein K2X30_09225 [bacterium]|jgi:diphosphomevalonate decarboxylase|nr:hypothetical protein [bacterium]